MHHRRRHRRYQDRRDTGEAAVPGRWHELILAVFDGATSKIKVGTSPIVDGATGVSLSGRNILGGQGSALATAGLVGGYAFLRAYDRALNNSDIEAASVELHRAYGLM